jgi:hypothetical protein
VAEGDGGERRGGARGEQLGDGAGAGRADAVAAEVEGREAAVAGVSKVGGEAGGAGVAELAPGRVERGVDGEAAEARVIEGANGGAEGGAADDGKVVGRGHVGMPVVAQGTRRRRVATATAARRSKSCCARARSAALCEVDGSGVVVEQGGAAQQREGLLAATAMTAKAPQCLGADSETVLASSPAVPRPGAPGLDPSLKPKLFEILCSTA